VVKGKEKYLKTQYRPAGMPLNVKAVSYFKSKIIISNSELRLKCRNNKLVFYNCKFPHRRTRKEPPLTVKIEEE
jgi:hypothetical protein